MDFDQCDIGYMKCLNVVVEPANKRTMLVFPEIFSYIHNDFYRNGFSSLSFLKESVRTFFLAKVFRKFSPFFEDFNEKIGQIFSSGLYFKALNEEMKPKDIKKVIEEIDPEVLTISHLSVGFKICFVSLAFSVLAFFSEVLIFKLKTFLLRFFLNFRI